MQSLSRCYERTECHGPEIIEFPATPYRAEYGNLVNCEAFDFNGTVFAPKQCLYQKVATGMGNLKMQSLSRCYIRTERHDPANHRVSCTAV